MLNLFPFEDRLTPSIPLPTGFTVGMETRTYGESPYFDPDLIRARTGDPSLGVPIAQGYDGAGAVQYTVGFGSPFSGGVRVASGDFDGNGFPDLVSATSPGIANRMRVQLGSAGKFSGQPVELGMPVLDVAPFETSFTGGVNLATGDVTGDGKPDIIVSPDEGGGPRVDIYDGATRTKLTSFFGIDDSDFRGGARTAIGDVNDDGFGDLLVAAGLGGGPRVAVFDGKFLATGSPTRLCNDFFVFESTLRNGVAVAAGDLNGDGFDEIIAGGGPGGGPRILAISGKDLLSSGGASLVQVANFFAGDANDRSGVRIVAKNIDGDSRADLIVAEGPSGNQNQPNRSLAIYSGLQLVSPSPPALLNGQEFGFFPFTAFLDGLWVG